MIEAQIFLNMFICGEMPMYFYGTNCAPF